MSKTVLFQTIQFRISTQFSLIWDIDRTLSSATTRGKSGIGNGVGNPALLESHHQIVLRHIQDTRLGSVTPLQRCNQCILKLKPAGPQLQACFQTNTLEIRERIETIQGTILLRLTRILRRVLETWGDLLSLRLTWKITCWRRGAK